MRLHRRLLLTSALAPLLSAPAWGASTLCVNPGGTGGCFASIQAAVDAATPGTDIDVAAGTYPEIVQVRRKNGLTIRGAGADVTTLNGPGMPGCVVALCLDANVTVEGMTIAGVSVGSNFMPRAKLSNVVVSGSSGAGIGVGTKSKLDLVGSTISGNPGNGIFNFGTLTVIASTITGNDVGVLNYRRATIVDSTISGNSSGACGGVVNNGDHGRRASLRIERSTIAGNQTTGFGAGGICNNDALTLKDSIVADNTSAGSSPDCADGGIYRFGFAVKVSGTALIEDPSGCTLVVPGSAQLLTGAPLLGPLQDNGGPTFTHALLPGSPAIGASTRAASCKKPDQRGVPRAVPCDLGAYEAP